MKELKDNVSFVSIRKLPVGAEIFPGQGVHFRIWAPDHSKVSIVLVDRSKAVTLHNKTFQLNQENNGYFSGLVQTAEPGTLYKVQIDNDVHLYPDPASRYQPSGTSGPSEVIDPDQFSWTDNDWSGISLKGQIFYELHIGTFTNEGTFQSARDQLKYLADTGITVIELMPLAEFPGTFNWGYDGVDMFAPEHLYGRPDDLRQLINQAHSYGIGVILDVVYNHLGPVDNFLNIFSKYYFTARYKNEWGDAINFDGENADPVREFFISNAGYWIKEFHFDGLRIDATQQIFDKSPENILSSITRKVKESARERATILVAENEPQDTRLIRPLEHGGYGMDGVWNDDFHHSGIVVLTGRKDAYYTDYLGSPQELISSSKYGFLYQGQYYTWQKNRRGTPTTGIKPSAFIVYLQNHDQIANSCCGTRIHELTGPGQYRAMTAFLLLSPGTPLLFQGQEFAASSPFLYFSNVSPELSNSIHLSRLKFLSQFQNLAQPETQAQIAHPDDPQTFNTSKLDLMESRQHKADYDLHCDLIRLRRQDPVFSAQCPGGVDGAIVGPQSFILRFFGEKSDDRLLIINLGNDLSLNPAPEPLMAPSLGSNGWRLIWSSEDLKYGGSGVPPLELNNIWHIPGHSATVLKSYFS